MNESVHLTTMQDTIQRALARWPHLRPKIERAASLLILGHVVRTEPGWYAVKSQTQPGHSYAVTTESCACKDRERHNDRPCKHMTACRLLEIAEERQHRLDRFAPLTGAELANLTAWKRRYEAGEVVR